MEVSKLIFVVALLEAVLWAQPNLCLDQQQSLCGILKDQKDLLDHLDHTKNQGVAIPPEVQSTIQETAERNSKEQETARIMQQQREKAVEATSAVVAGENVKASEPAAQQQQKSMLNVMVYAEHRPAKAKAKAETAAADIDDEHTTSAAVPMLDAGQAKTLMFVALFAAWAATAAPAIQQAEAADADKEEEKEDDYCCREPEAKRAAKAKPEIVPAQVPYVESVSIVSTPSDTSDIEESEYMSRGVSPYVLTPDANFGVPSFLPTFAATDVSPAARNTRRAKHRVKRAKRASPAATVVATKTLAKTSSISILCSLPKTLQSAFRSEKRMYCNMIEPPSSSSTSTFPQQQVTAAFDAAAVVNSGQWFAEQFHADAGSNPGTLPATIPVVPTADDVAFFDAFLEESVLC